MTTLSEYLLVNNNLANYQKLTASDPTVKSATAYYNQNIRSVHTPQDLVNNYRLFSYALTAFGLGDRVDQKALFQKVLEQGTGSASDLANKLSDNRIVAFAKAFDFNTYGAATTVTTNATSDIVAKYQEQALETNEGQTNPGVQLALYFKSHASSITTPYGILADKNILTVVETALGLSKYISNEPIDTQAKLITKKLNIADLQDPAKVNKLIQRFAANYDIQNGSTGTTPGTIALSLISGGGGGNAGNGVLSIVHSSAAGAPSSGVLSIINGG